MAPKSKTAAPGKGAGYAFQRVPSDLNLWPKDDDPVKGEQILGLVTFVDPAGKYGLTVKIMEPNGTIRTLASHKVLQGRLESVPIGLRPLKTVLRVTYTGKEKGSTWPTPMLMYDLDWAERVPGDSDLWPNLPFEVVK